MLHVSKVTIYLCNSSHVFLFLLGPVLPCAPLSSVKTEIIPQSKLNLKLRIAICYELILLGEHIFTFHVQFCKCDQENLHSVAHCNPKSIKLCIFYVLSWELLSMRWKNRIHTICFNLGVALEIS